jgi:hypothetical protein
MELSRIENADNILASLSCLQVVKEKLTLRISFARYALHFTVWTEANQHNTMLGNPLPGE